MNVNASMGPLNLEATDDNSNLDENFGESVLFVRLGGSGTLASTDPLGLN